MVDVVIIGAGPAGLSAGIYAARGGLSVAIVENNSAGGQASSAYDIQNYPGIFSSSGFDLCYTMLKQCRDLGCKFFQKNISEYDLEKETKRLFFSDGKDLEAKRVIIATGASARPLGIAREKDFIGKGVSYCATCDGMFFKNKTVAVIGGGNTAAEDALYLEKIASKVYLIHRRDELRADKILAERIKNSKIEVVWNSVVHNLIGEDKLTKIQLKDVKNDSLTEIYADGVFVAIGQIPNSDQFENLNKDEHGYIVTDELMRTNLTGVYAAGDIRKKTLRQVVTACADGAIAADSVIKELL